jgi:hypothetical protein
MHTVNSVNLIRRTRHNHLNLEISQSFFEFPLSPAHLTAAAKDALETRQAEEVEDGNVSSLEGLVQRW